MSSSDLSPSPPSSPAASGVRQEPNLEQLVALFVAAKRSLTSTSHGWRANELVTSSRSLVEEIATLNGKNTFATRGIEGHVDTLQAIRDGIAEAGKQVTDEFKSTIASLDQANGRLQDTLKSLRETVLHQSLLRPHLEHVPCEDPDRDEDEGREIDETSNVLKRGTVEQKTLHDFILESDHENILASLRTLIDSFQAAHGDFDDGLATFDSTLSTIGLKLSHYNTASQHLHGSSASDPLPSVRSLFTSLEAHASSMATLLQSLISHYDLCVSALKHTEGGGHAAFLAAQAEQLTSKSPSNSTAGAEESLYRKTVPEPISNFERAEMLSILTSDAEEVDDVVSELKDRSTDMESQFTYLLSHATQFRRMHRQLHSAVSMLHNLRATALPLHLNALRAFSKTWKSIHAAISTKTAALVALTDFHAHFLDAYEKLLTEMKRRESAEAKMCKVADKTQRELDRLWEMDCEAREGFMEEAGRYLPGDLYPAIGSESRKWVLTRERSSEAEVAGPDTEGS